MPKCRIACTLSAYHDNLTEVTITLLIDTECISSFHSFCRVGIKYKQDQTRPVHIVIVTTLNLNPKPYTLIPQATPGLLNALSSESRNSTIVSSILLGLEDQLSAAEDAVVHLYIPFGSPQCDNVHFRGK